MLMPFPWRRRHLDDNLCGRTVANANNWTIRQVFGSVTELTPVLSDFEFLLGQATSHESRTGNVSDRDNHPVRL